MRRTRTVVVRPMAAEESWEAAASNTMPVTGWGTPDSGT
jgi:hypothetical protein